MSKSKMTTIVTIFILGLIAISFLIFFLFSKKNVKIINDDDPKSNTTDTKPENTNTNENTQDNNGEAQKPQENNSQENKPQENDLQDNNLPMDDKSRLEKINSILNDKYAILVNRTNKISSDYKPSSMITVGDYPIEAVAGAALKEMMNGARNAGYASLYMYSGYRTYASQKNKFEARTQTYMSQGLSREAAEKKAGEYIAPPGASEHQTGLAADISIPSIVNKYGSLTDDFDQTETFAWLKANSYKYGFILRYDKNTTSITGYNYEPWHFRYVGKDIAKEVYEKGVTFEEYISALKAEKKQLEEKLNK